MPSPFTRTCTTRPMQSNKSETAPITAKQVASEITKSQPTWEVPERRVAKFVKKEVGSAGNIATMSEGKKGSKFKLTSPFGKNKKKKAIAAKESAEAAASPPAKDAVDAAEAKVASEVKSAASPVKEELAADAEKALSPTKDAYAEDKEDGGPEPWCSSCTIC